MAPIRNKLGNDRMTTPQQLRHCRSLATAGSYYDSVFSRMNPCLNQINEHCDKILFQYYLTGVFRPCRTKYLSGFRSMILLSNEITQQRQRNSTSKPTMASSMRK